MADHATPPLGKSLDKIPRNRFFVASVIENNNDYENFKSSYFDVNHAS